MKTSRILFTFAVLALLAFPKAYAQNFVSQKEAVKVAVNYINGYLEGNENSTMPQLW